MSISTLESLPNEILADLFDKYINGIDIIRAFAFQQNGRIDSILDECQRHNFNFINCRNDHFQLCMRILPYYVQRIEELAISDYDTFGQVLAFLTTFPSLHRFTKLRKLYIHVDAVSVQWNRIEQALLTLAITPIKTLIIKVSNSKGILLFDSTFDIVPQLSTLRRLVFIGYLPHTRWEFSKLSHQICDFSYLQTIFDRYPLLKYLNIRFTPPSNVDSTYPIVSTNRNIQSMPALHTLIISFPRDHSTTFNMLSEYLQNMPALHRLEIKTHQALIDAIAWETLFQTALLSLTHFRLQTTYRFTDDELETLLQSFETPFWINMQNFYFIITEHQHIEYDLFRLSNDTKDEFDDPVIRWWIVPFRNLNDDIPVNDITNFAISNKTNSISIYYQFNHIQNLTICRLDTNVLNWLRTHVNLVGVKHLDISPLRSKCEILSLLLSDVQNINSLRIRCYQLYDYQHELLNRIKFIKSLDITSDGEHSYGLEQIPLVTQLVPNVECLVIRTSTIPDLILLQNQLPHIRSITFKLHDKLRLLSVVRQRNLFHTSLRIDYHLRSLEESSSITIWIDSASLANLHVQGNYLESLGSNAVLNDNYDFDTRL
ncbi:hypothetical protein I4U23_024610 [Adineta vaga]|nr:hypothetical protein I4U23_024610 [Adineta vaga]